MPFVEQEEGFSEQKIDGKTVQSLQAKSRSDFKTLKTGREYMSDAEAQEDVDSPVY